MLDFGELPRDPGVDPFRDLGGAHALCGQVDLDSQPRACTLQGAVRTAAGRMDAGTPDRRLPPLDTFRTRRPGPREPLDQGAPTAREHRLASSRRPPRVHPLPARHPISDPRGRTDPAAGHAVTIGPLRGRRLALELVEQLDSLFGLRHCGRDWFGGSIPRRTGRWAAACRRASAIWIRTCIGDAWRRRWGCSCGGDGATLDGRSSPRCVSPAQRRYERALALRRRARRLRVIPGGLGGVLEATQPGRAWFCAHPTRRGRVRRLLAGRGAPCRLGTIASRPRRARASHRRRMKARDARG